MIASAPLALWALPRNGTNRRSADKTTPKRKCRRFMDISWTRFWQQPDFQSYARGLEPGLSRSRRKAGLADDYADAVTAAPLKNASRSALTRSAWVAGMPCGRSS